MERADRGQELRIRSIEQAASALFDDLGEGTQIVRDDRCLAGERFDENDSKCFVGQRWDEARLGVVIQMTQLVQYATPQLPDNSNLGEEPVATEVEPPVSRQ